MTHHHLHSSPETCHWGFFEAKLKPVLTVKSGDEVTVEYSKPAADAYADAETAGAQRARIIKTS